MKTICRIIALALVALMMLPAVACGKKKNTSAVKTDAGTSSPSLSDKFVEKPDVGGKYDGETIRFFVNTGGGDGSLNIRSLFIGEDDDQTYEVNKAVMQRNDIVENELGVTLELTETGSMQGTVKQISPTLGSRNYTWDILSLYQYYDLGLAIGDTLGCFYNLLNMPEDSKLDIEAPYWNQALFDTLTYGGYAAYITGDISQTTTGNMFVTFVNATMWEQFKDSIKTLPNNPNGYDSIYDIVKNGYWTLDLWMDLCKMCYEDSNHNDRIDYGDRAGLMVYNPQINNVPIDAITVGSRFTYSTYDSDGKPMAAVNSDRNVEFGTKLAQLLTESSALVHEYPNADKLAEADRHYITDIFAEGNLLMFAHELSNAEGDDLANMTDEFYVVPPPMLSHEQFDANSPSLGYASQLGDSVSQFAICRWIPDEKVAAVTATLELMGYYSMKDVTPVYFDTALKDRYTRHEEDKEMIDLTRAGIYGDFVQMWSNQLDNPTHWNRSHFNEGSKIARNYMQLNDSIASKLENKAGTGLLTKLEEVKQID